MGDGGVAYVPLQQQQQQQQLIMESLSVTQKSLCGGKNGNNGFKMVKIKKENKGRKGESERTELDLRKSNEEVENGEIVDKVPKEEVEEGELGTLKWPKIESENGEFWPGRQRRSDFEKGEIGGDKWRRGESEKGESGGGKWRKGDLEKGEFVSWRTTRDEIEKGEFIPDRCPKLDARKDEYYYSKQRRHDSGREKSWKYDHEWTPPPGKHTSENACRRKDFSRSVNHHSKNSSRWEFGQERNIRLSSKIVDDDSSHKAEHDNGKECGAEPSSANRLKRYTGDSDTSERKYHGDYGDYAASKSRRLSDDCSRPAHSENHSRRSADKSIRHSSSKIFTSDKYSSRHPELSSSSSSRVVHDRHGHSPGHSERSPHDRVKYSDNRDRSPVGRNKSPYIHDRSPYGRERSPGDRNRFYDHRNRSPSHTERSYSRGRSPFDRSRYYDYRNRSPTHGERSPQNRTRYHDSRGRTPKYQDKSPLDRNRNNIREANRKSGPTEKCDTQNDNKGNEEKLNRKDPGERDLNTSVKESLEGSSGENVDGLIDKIADCGSLKEEPSQSPVEDMDICETPPQVPQELASMEEDMDICDTPPHAPVVTDSSSGKWFYLDNLGVECGPARLSELKSLVEEGSLVSDHFIKHLDSDRWVTVENAASPMVVMNFPSIVSDTITRLVSPPEAPGNLLADNGDAGQCGTQKNEEISLQPSSLDYIAADAGPANNLHIDERVGTLLEGFSVIPGKELEIIGEALQTTFKSVQWEGWEYAEGCNWNPIQSAETHDKKVEATLEYSDLKSTEAVDSRSHVPPDRDYALLSSDSGIDRYSSRWSCKGGDWKRNDDSAIDRSSRKKLVLNDGFPLCQMPKSGCEDPRWHCKDELYCPSYARRLDLPPWAFSSIDEKNDSSSASKSAQTKPMLMRGVKGTMMPVVRINACVVKDHGFIVSESRMKAKGRDRYPSRSARPFTGTSDAKRSSTEGFYHSRATGKHMSKGSWKDVTFISTPKDRLCSVDELQLHLGEWYYFDGAGHEQGPFSLPELQKLVEQGIIQKYTSVFRKSDGVWVPVASVVEALGGVGKSGSGVSVCCFKSLYPQFIGYTRGKLHELVMKSYKSREFATAINEVLDPWINAKQPKKEMESHIYRKTDGGQHAAKRVRILIDPNEEDSEMEEGIQSTQRDELNFEDLCGGDIFHSEETTHSEAEMGVWGLLDGNLLARVFHFLRSDLKSLIFASLTCKRWRASVRFYKGISKQVDFSSLGLSCSDCIFQKIMNEYRKEKINSLVLFGCTNITSGVLEEILCSFPSLSSIDIRGCSQFGDLVLKFPNVCWIKSQMSARAKIAGDFHSKMKSLKQIAEKTLPVSKTKVDTDDFGELKEYFDSVNKRDSASNSFCRSLYKRSKVFDARKSSSILSRDARIRRWAIKKSEFGYKRMEGFLASSLKEIMNENTFDFFVPKVAEIEDRMNNGYYISHGLSSVREDISRMCRDAIKAKNRGDAKDMNRIITLFIQLATRLEGSEKSSHHRDEITRLWKDDSTAGFGSACLKYKKLSKVVSDKKCTNRSNGSLIGSPFDHGEAASDREIKRRLSKLNRRSMDSGSETSEDHYDSSEDSKGYSETTVSEAENDQDLSLEGRTGGSRGDGYFSEDESLYYMNDDREWGARMTKASLVPPVTRTYEVIDQYVIVADEKDVQRKMRVSLPEDYAEKLYAQRNGSEESDMELPEVKDFKPRKQLGDEVIEQEVYGIDPYTHNLLLDSMPEELDWPLSDKHIFIEEVLLHTLNKQVRHYTGTGCTPMMYDLRPVIEEIGRNAEEKHDMRTLRICQGILKAMDCRPDDKYVAYRKGLGVVCNKEGGFGEEDFVVEFLGEVYPAWKWFEKQDGIRSLQKNNKDPAPEFYNIYLERPKGDADGYDLVVVDAMHKANYASRICHSCRPNCEAKVTAVNGQYQIGIYSVRPIQRGEEITFDYNSVTESKEEYEASVCLCGSQVCRGSYLNLTGEGAFQKVLKEWHGLLDRFQLMLEACELNFVTKEDYIDLGRAGLGSCLLGGLPDWLIAYAARLVRFINTERTELPNEILRHNLEEKRKYFSEICLDVEKSDAEVQAEGVYNQRLQNLAITLDKVRYVMRCIFGDPKKAPPPLERLSPEDAASFLWNGEGSLVEELLQSIAPHMEDGMLNDLKSKIRARDPIASDNILKELRRSLLWLRDEIRYLPCTYKCRHDAAADLIHIYAYTKCFFRIREYQTVTSSPVYISPLDLGPKYADKLGGGLHEYCKQYGENYCLGQLIFWHMQTNADPGSSLIRTSRGCLSLPDIGSFYAKKPQKHCVYGPRTVKYMLSRMEKQPQRPWPKDRIWSFKSSPKVFGSPMLDAVLCNSLLNRDMVNWLRNRPTVYQEMWDR